MSALASNFRAITRLETLATYAGYVCIGLTDTRCSLWVLFWKLSAGYKPKQELQRDLQPKVSFYVSNTTSQSM